MTPTDLKEVPEKAKRGRPHKDETVTTEKVDSGDYSAEIIRDYYGDIDPFYLSKKDPNYEYRFLRDDHKNLLIKTSNLLLPKGGWQICPKAHLFKIGIKEQDLSPDGFLRRGDTILAFIPKKLYEEKNKYKIDKANAPIKTINRLLKEGDASIGGKDIHASMEGIKTGKQLGMK